jgi:hypothetical protein
MSKLIEVYTSKVDSRTVIKFEERLYPFTYTQCKNEMFTWVEEVRLYSRNLSSEPKGYYRTHKSQLRVVVGYP